MGIRYTRSTGGAMDGSSYRQMAKEMLGIIEDELTIVGEDSVKEARTIVETSGTNREWTGSFRDRNGNIRTASGAGRVDTGEMIDALDYRIVKGKTIGLDVGWIHLWEVYFAAQDEGFDAPGYRRANLAVEGMHVISHLQVYMRGKVDEALDRAEKRIVNGL